MKVVILKSKDTLSFADTGSWGGVAEREKSQPARLASLTLRGKIFGKFANAFLWLNRQSSFDGAFRVEEVKLAMNLRVIGDA